jgi:hypothetical protein
MTDPNGGPLLDDAELDDKEKERETIRKENAKLLKQFKTWMESSGTSQTTVRKHWGNLEFVLNHFLLYSDTLTADEGISEVGEFLGWWFIRKAI